jgi:hypothetical protein
MKEFLEKSTKAGDLIPLVRAAQVLGVRYSTAMDLVLTGSLKGIQIGRSWFVYKTALQEASGKRAAGAFTLRASLDATSQ